MWGSPETIEELSALAVEFSENIPLDRALLCIAQDEYPELDVTERLHVLDHLAEDAARLIAQQNVDARNALCQVLFQDGGFRANADNYHDPKNSLLPDVIDRRLGIPITMSVIYMETARRLGESVEGIGFPGHFLVRQTVRGASVLVDPFAQGAIVDRDFCQALLERITGGPAELKPWMFQPSCNRTVVLRTLSNLKHAYLLNNDIMSAIRTINRILAVDGERQTDIRDRGLLFSAIDCAGAAVVDLETYLARAEPGGLEQHKLERLLISLRKQRTFAN